MTIVLFHAKVSRFQVRFYTVRLAHAASRARRCLSSAFNRIIIQIEQSKMSVCAINAASQSPHTIRIITRTKSLDRASLAGILYTFFQSLCGMSSECERVFLSRAKMTTTKSSGLSGIMLQHQECLKNCQRRGAIVMAVAYNAILIV